MGQCISSARHYEDAPTPKMVRSTQSTQSQPRKLHVTVSLDSSSDQKVCISFEMEEEQTPVESANKIAPEPSKKYYYNDIHITTVRQICVLYKYHGYETNGLLTYAVASSFIPHYRPVLIRRSLRPNGHRGNCQKKLSLAQLAFANNGRFLWFAWQPAMGRF